MKKELTISSKELGSAGKFELLEDVDSLKKINKDTFNDVKTIEQLYYESDYLVDSNIHKVITIVAYASIFCKMIKSEKLWTDGIKSLVKLKNGKLKIIDNTKLIEVK